MPLSGHTPRVLLVLSLTLVLATGQMLGGFKQVSDHANNAQVEAAKGVAVAKLGVAPAAVQVLSAETQVVAGTNYKLKLKVDGGSGSKFYEAKIWEKLPAHGGAMELTSLDEISAAQAGTAADECPGSPEVDDAAAYAVQQLSSQSNSLFPFTLKKVLSARLHRGDGGVTHHLRLQLSHGSMPDTVYEVEVANPGGSYQLQNSQQVVAE